MKITWIFAFIIGMVLMVSGAFAGPAPYKRGGGYGGHRGGGYGGHHGGGGYHKGGYGGHRGGGYGGHRGGWGHKG